MSTEPTILPPLPDEDLDAVIERTRELWRDLAGERVFVTGGTGWFGVWLLESFVRANRRLALNARAHVLSRRPQAFAAKLPHLGAAPELSFQAGDATSFDFPVGRFACVIHAANGSNDAMQDRLAFYESDVQATRRTLDFALSASASRYLFTSSGAVYGKQPHDVANVAEDAALAPATDDARTVYGQAKRASEFLCTLYAERHGLGATIARCFAFVGPHMPLHTGLAAGNFLRDALRGEPIRIGGDGTPYRSYMYMSDLLVWLWTILLRGAAARPYNVGSDRAISIAELAQRMAACVSPSSRIELASAPRPGAHALRYVPSIERARAELGLTLNVDLDAAIARSAAWLRTFDATRSRGDA